MLWNSHEYVFTEWAGGAADDLDAPRKVFDSNGDGKLTSADARWGEFRVLVSPADEAIADSLAVSAGTVDGSWGDQWARALYNKTRHNQKLTFLK